MTAINQRIEVWRGDSKLIGVPLTQLPDNIAFDETITDAQWWVITSLHATHDQALLRKWLGGGITVVAGGVTIELEAVDTQDLEPGNYFHVLRINWGVDEVATAMVGPFVLRHAPDMRPHAHAVTGVVYVDAETFMTATIGA